MTPITISVVATNACGAFVGWDANAAEYCVFTLGDSHEISVGDRLTGDFHGHSAATFVAQNLTRGGRPWIDLRDWDLPLVGAVERLVAMGPAAEFIVGNQVRVPHSDDVVRQLVDEIGRGR